MNAPDTFFTITRDDAGHHAVSPELAVTALPDVEVVMFNRTAQRINPQPGQPEIERMLVIDVGGVRLYLRAGNIIISHEDLYL